MNRLIEHIDNINLMLARYGVKFGIYKNNEFHEQLFPFDAFPRVIGHNEFAYLEKGLIQRVTALNMFLADIYGEKNILKDGVVPKNLFTLQKAISPNASPSALLPAYTATYPALIWYRLRMESGMCWRII